MTVFKVEYLCLLDGGCNPGRREHSLNCQARNVEREKALFARERASRARHMEADISGKPRDLS